MKCKMCGKNYMVSESGSKSFCPDCQEDYEKRNRFREIMSELKEIAELDHLNFTYMKGYSYSEMEGFSLTMRKIMKRSHFPLEENDFVNERAKEQAKEVFKKF